MRSLISIDFPAPKMEPESAHVVSAVSVHWLQCGDCDAAPPRQHTKPGQKFFLLTRMVPPMYHSLRRETIKVADSQSAMGVKSLPRGSKVFNKYNHSNGSRPPARKPTNSSTARNTSSNHLVWVFCLGSGPFPCFASLLFLVGETQIWPGDLRVVGVGGLCFWFCFTICRLYYGTKAFHDEFSNLFTRFSPMLRPSLGAMSAATEEK